MVKNRVHLDLVADDREKEITLLVELGATRGPDHDEYGHTWSVMADPEANDFCIAQEPAHNIPAVLGRLRMPGPWRSAPAGRPRQAGQQG